MLKAKMLELTKKFSFLFFYESRLLLVAIMLAIVGSGHLLASDVVVEGCVLDSTTNEPLAFVSISIKDTGFGGTTNLSGEFELKLAGDKEKVLLVFSLVGYKTKIVPFNINLDKSIAVLLKEDTVMLPEMLISSLSGIEIIDKVVNSVEKNYNQKDFHVLGFQRETVKSDKEYNQLLEADFITDYRSNIGKTFLISGRYAENKKARKEDLLWDDKKGGFYTFGLTHLGGISSPIDTHFLGLPVEGKNNYQKHYNFQLKNIINFNKKNLYVVEFDQKLQSKKSLIMGEIFVNSEDFAIVKIKYSLSENGKKFLKTNSTWDGVELTKSKMFKKIDVLQEYVTMSFKKYGMYWYPSTYIRDIEFTATVKLPGRKSPTKKLNLHSECVITSINPEGHSNLERKEIPSDLYYFQVYLKNNCKNYSPSDWGRYTAIKSDTNYSLVVEKISAINAQVVDSDD